MTYNTNREVFPGNIIAGMFNFVTAELFVIEKARREGRAQSAVLIAAGDSRIHPFFIRNESGNR